MAALGDTDVAASWQPPRGVSNVQGYEITATETAAAQFAAMSVAGPASISQAAVMAPTSTVTVGARRAQRHRDQPPARHRLRDVHPSNYKPGHRSSRHRIRPHHRRVLAAGITVRHPSGCPDPPVAGSVAWVIPRSVQTRNPTPPTWGNRPVPSETCPPVTAASLSESDLGDAPPEKAIRSVVVGGGLGLHEPLSVAIARRSRRGDNESPVVVDSFHEQTAT